LLQPQDEGSDPGHEVGSEVTGDDIGLEIGSEVTGDDVGLEVKGSVGDGVGSELTGAGVGAAGVPVVQVGTSQSSQRVSGFVV
jgi:hypothetical protein